MGGGGKGENKSGEALGKIAQRFFGETTPLRRELIGQYEEGLTTGGVGARMPIISKSQEASRRATSNTLAGLDQQLAQSGLAGTPFGVQQRTEAEQRGRYATSQIPTQIVGQMLAQIPGFVTGSNQVTVSGLGQAAGAEAQSQGASANFLQSMMSPFNFSYDMGK
jgi:hypothetical protein